MKSIALYTGSAFVLSALLFAPCIFAANNNARSSVEALEIKSTIEKYNNIKPLQNPRYERSSKILKRRIIDGKNKTVGNVKDIIFDKRNGRVRTLYIEFDRLNLQKAVYLDYDKMDIRSFSTGYRINFGKDEIKTLYPVLLSNIEPASGNIKDAPDISLGRILGSKLVSSTGKKLGNVEDVLFNDKGKYVRSIYLNINHRTVHNKGVAMPLSILSFEENNGRIKTVIDEAYVETIVSMAKRG